MTIVSELANGSTEVFETQNYMISRVRDFHPMILKVSVYDAGRKIKEKRRVWPWWYKNVTFKSDKVQRLLKEIEEQKKKEKE